MLFSRDICLRFIRGKSKSSTKVYLLQNGAIHSASQPASFDMWIQNKKKNREEKNSETNPALWFFFQNKIICSFFIDGLCILYPFEYLWENHHEIRNHADIQECLMCDFNQISIILTHAMINVRCTTDKFESNVIVDVVDVASNRQTKFIHGYLMHASFWFISSNTLRNSIMNDKSSYFHVYV